MLVWHWARVRSEDHRQLLAPVASRVGIASKMELWSGESLNSGLPQCRNIISQWKKGMEVNISGTCVQHRATCKHSRKVFKCRGWDNGAQRDIIQFVEEYMYTCLCVYIYIYMSVYLYVQHNIHICYACIK